MLIHTTEHFEPDVTSWPSVDIVMGPSRFLSTRAAQRYASDRRAELFSLFNRLATVRRHGPAPFDRKLRAMTFANVRARVAMAAKVLP